MQDQAMGKTKTELKELIKNKAEGVVPEQEPKAEFKLIGTYKLKDRKGRDVIAFKIMPDMEGVVIQKVKGSANKIVVVVKMVPVAKHDKVNKSKEIKNEKESKA